MVKHQFYFPISSTFFPPQTKHLKFINIRHFTIDLISMMVGFSQKAII